MINLSNNNLELNSLSNQLPEKKKIEENNLKSLFSFFTTDPILSKLDLHMTQEYLELTVEPNTFGLLLQNRAILESYQALELQKQAAKIYTVSLLDYTLIESQYEQYFKHYSHIVSTCAALYLRIGRFRIKLSIIEHLLNCASYKNLALNAKLNRLRSSMLKEKLYLGDNSPIII